MYVWSLPIQQFALFRKRWHRRVSLTVGGVCLFPAGSQWLRLYGPCVPGWAPTLQWIFHKANTKIRVGGTQNWTQISCANDHDGWLYYGRILKLTAGCFNFCGRVNAILLGGTVVIYCKTNIQFKGQCASHPLWYNYGDSMVWQ